MLTLLSSRLAFVSACTASQATTIVAARPFDSVDDLRLKFTKKRGISQKIFDDYIEIMEGYAKVDAVLLGCETVGEELERAMSVFTERANGKGKEKETDVIAVKVEDETAVDLVAGVDDVETLLEAEKDPERRKALRGYLKQQPEALAEGVVLKDYQVSLTISERDQFRRVMCLTSLVHRLYSCSASTGSTCFTGKGCRAS